MHKPIDRTEIYRMLAMAELDVIALLRQQSGISQKDSDEFSLQAIELVNQIRQGSQHGMMETFLAEYGLSSKEGVALMCLAEALLRVPDAETIDQLIDDKISPSSWGQHLGKSSSSLVNASTWGLMITGKILKNKKNETISDILHGMLRRLGEPLIRSAVRAAMIKMGHQFVLGRDIAEAFQRGSVQREKGYGYSFDMLGEAALTSNDAQNYFEAYSEAILYLGERAEKENIKENSGISIKLSALFPRYETRQQEAVMSELVPRVLSLCLMAKAGGLGLNIDAEEMDRLDISLDVIEAVLSSSELQGWDGFGVVVQAYGKGAIAVIGWLYELASSLDRRIMVRLVKGAYWDTEIKLAQMEGVRQYPVYTTKAATDVAYICCAERLLGYADRLYAQFATHNAHTVAALLHLAGNHKHFEFQKLHGMGDALYDTVIKQHHVHCRIYAPVGAHKDLLAYLVRRLLENGANSSFVHQLVDPSIAPEVIATDPFFAKKQKSKIILPKDIFMPERMNSAGWNVNNFWDLRFFDTLRMPYQFYPISPLQESTTEEVDWVLQTTSSWQVAANERREILLSAADLYEDNTGKISAILCREARKTVPDVVSELREAVDFLRYYAERALECTLPARGVICCISPWNFPLAIFTGQIVAALSAGNGVIAKPAEQTPMIAELAVELLHQAGVPRQVLRLVQGRGATIGKQLTSDDTISGVCFTGSTETAHVINQSISNNFRPNSLFIAETGGLNAMIVDSTALPEQAVRDVIQSAFYSAGQRCSALRMLYIQADIYETFLTLLFGAMDELVLGDPWDSATDIGPVIDAEAYQTIQEYIQSLRGFVLKEIPNPQDGYFIAPTVIACSGIEELQREIFGPVLHVAPFHAANLDQVVQSINQCGYGLTFGLHSRIDDRVEKITSSLKVGNMYINRNQIGAVVGSQPFGGEGLSGTGPKAGGGQYVQRFLKQPIPERKVVTAATLDFDTVQTALDKLSREHDQPLHSQELPSPTGESNCSVTYPRGVILCLGANVDDARKQKLLVAAIGCTALVVAPHATEQGEVDGFLPRGYIKHLQGFDAVVLWSDHADQKQAAIALAERDGTIIPLIVTENIVDYCTVTRHVCINTTASGGNVELLSIG